MSPHLTILPARCGSREPLYDHITEVLSPFCLGIKSDQAGQKFDPSSGRIVLRRRRIRHGQEARSQRHRSSGCWETRHRRGLLPHL
jgi:hypothetical protein